ncbi:hypothetical protein TanjilG_22262 [Lupinus angustifolius]|uniref:non-specific serine/threonine protein kinase n=1 Tax=Lupinus angustifolius TaxID=3871 RepID=A0A1J7HKS2_LUPAN|nr:hypothetical protein TanjilG_22262 [Lupinus angustifolius]
MGINVSDELSKKTSIFGLKIWEIIGIAVGLFTIIILSVLSICLTSRKKSRKVIKDNKFLVSQIPSFSKEIKEVRVEQVSSNAFAPSDGMLVTVRDKSNAKESDEVMVHLGVGKKRGNWDSGSRSDSFHRVEKDGGGSLQSGEEGSSGTITLYKHSSSSLPLTAPSPLSGLPEFSHLGWGHWFTLRDLQLATNRFSKDNVVGEGGYGIVYHGQLVNGTPVAVKKILNNVGQAEKEFRVEVEAIGHVRHKNLVRLLGYCIEGTDRMLVYEYVNNGNLEQWLHGAMRHEGYLTWEARIKILLGTAKALAYLHEAIEPKVVHRDIKSSNILIDSDFNAKVSDFGLAKLLEAGESHVTTRVMGTFGRSEEVLDENIEVKPSTRALKKVLLTALRCVDPDSEKRPKMSQVVRMLESEEYPLPREDRRHRKTKGGSAEIESLKEFSDIEKSES